MWPIAHVNRIIQQSTTCIPLLDEELINIRPRTSSYKFSIQGTWSKIYSCSFPSFRWNKVFPLPCRAIMELKRGKLSSPSLFPYKSRSAPRSYGCEKSPPNYARRPSNFRRKAPMLTEQNGKVTQVMPAQIDGGKFSTFFFPFSRRLKVGEKENKVLEVTFRETRSRTNFLRRNDHYDAFIFYSLFGGLMHEFLFLPASSLVRV